MSPAFRKTLLGIGALIALLVIGCIVLVATFDANRYKSVAIDWMKDNRNRTLAIDGDISLSVFPRLAVRVGGVKLSEPGRADTFAAVDSASLSLELWPLLSGQLVIDRVEASGVQATLTRDAKGRRNTDDLAGPAAAGAAASAPAASAPDSAAPAMRFDVSRIALDNAQITLRDEMVALEGTLKIERLETGRIAGGLRSPVKLAASFDFTRPALAGKLQGAFDITPDFDKGGIALADVSLDYVGTVPGGLRLSGASIAARRLAYDPATQALGLEALKLRAKGDQAGAPLSAELDWPQLDLRGSTLKGSGLSGRLERGGAQAAQVTFKTGAPEGSFEALRIPGLDAQISADAGGQKLAGALRGQVSVQPPKKTAQWTLGGSVAKNLFETNGSVAWGAAAPTVRAQARFDSLDLNTLMPAPAAAAAPAASAPAAADTKVDLGALNAINGSVSVRAGRLIVRQVQVREARLDASIESGVLKLSTLTGKAFGGQIDASGSADARGRVALRATGTGIDIAAVLKDVAQQDLLEGTGRVAVDVSSAGRTVRELRSRVAGTAQLNLRDGAVKGVNLAKTLRQAKAALSARQDAEVRASRTEKTDFSELSASFRILEGVARSSDLDLKSPFLRLGGEGFIDIGNGLIDYTARASVVDTSAGQGGGDLASLKGLTIPVRLSGPLEAVDWKIQWSAVAAAAVRGQAEDKLKEKLGIAQGASAPSAKEQVKEKLLDKLLKKK